MAEPNIHSAPQRVGLPASKRLTGPHAAVWKYDLLTALSVFALGQGATMQTSILRLIAVATARYDWRRDELSIGRVELMRLWQCSEPTVKRELRRLREMGLLVQLRAGVRGRVAAYRLCRHALERLTQGHWVHAGPDFTARMQGTPEREPPAGNVVSFPQTDAEKGRALAPWARALNEAEPTVFGNWFSEVVARQQGDEAIFTAPSPFIAQQIETRFPRQMLEAARYAWPTAQTVRVEVQAP
ncbi:MAG: hypothetical protein AAF293_07425 [Pseudomonadota bacterium]